MPYSSTNSHFVFIINSNWNVGKGRVLAFGGLNYNHFSSILLIPAFQSRWWHNNLCQSSRIGWWGIWPFLQLTVHCIVLLQGSYKSWKSLNVLEFENKNWRPEMSLIVKKYLKFLKFWIFSIWHFINGHFVELILHVHIWHSCLKLIKVAFWTIQCHILLISKPSLQYLVCEFADIYGLWMSLKLKPLNLTLPEVHKPCIVL